MTDNFILKLGYVWLCDVIQFPVKNGSYVGEGYPFFSAFGIDPARYNAKVPRKPAQWKQGLVAQRIAKNLMGPGCFWCFLVTNC